MFKRILLLIIVLALIGGLAFIDSDFTVWRRNLSTPETIVEKIDCGRVDVMYVKKHTWAKQWQTSLGSGPRVYEFPQDNKIRLVNSDGKSVTFTLSPGGVPESTSSLLQFDLGWGETGQMYSLQRLSVEEKKTLFQLVPGAEAPRIAAHVGISDDFFNAQEFDDLRSCQAFQAFVNKVLTNTQDYGKPVNLYFYSSNRF